ncbi:alkaline shock response membrane anchor protein AmaP [Spirillospora sp. NBC_01491]|uniref:alkaline shock response membrane anchor protein AmaP n=1 Tax=Spirillospora sp. NBC_01491 TaxID=2976007 RepID=UPI002E349D8A|nr:alkaline shock response membrane anchor protein AmaP [Spirillospora sp. NBC_01491]
MDRRAARLNRIALTVLGLVLLGAGGAALARALGAWGGGRASEPLLTGQVRRFAADQGWFWPLLAAIAVVLTLFGLYWLVAQGRSHRLPGLNLAPDDADGKTRLSAGAITNVVQDEIEEYPGVNGARARLMGTADRPRLRLNVSYSHRADLAALRTRIGEEAVPRLCAALEHDSLPTVVRLRLVPAKENRTVV